MQCCCTPVAGSRHLDAVRPALNSLANYFAPTAAASCRCGDRTWYSSCSLIIRYYFFWQLIFLLILYIHESLLVGSTAKKQQDKTSCCRGQRTTKRFFFISCGFEISDTGHWLRTSEFRFLLFASRRNGQCPFSLTSNLYFSDILRGWKAALEKIWGCNQS